MKNNKIEFGRRQFVLGALATGMLNAIGELPSLARVAHANVPDLNRPVLSSMFLNGGPDHRHLFMPVYSDNTSTYEGGFWKARERLQLRSTDDGTTLADRWEQAYLPRSDSRSGTSFGIFSGAGWLADMYDAGNVAIVSNVFCDDSRDHENAIRSIELGNREARKLTRGSGWGGRAAYSAGGNVVALTRSIRTFCLGPDPSNPTNLFRWSDDEVIPAPDMRDLQPSYPPQGQYHGNGQQVARSLRAYYAAKRAELPANSPYIRFLDQEQKLREFGEVVEDRLATVELPDALATLGRENAGYEGPVSRGLGQQMRNLYDAVACYDLLDMRVASMEYNGWDTHDQQRAEIEYRLSALYGRGQALDALWSNLPTAARQRMVLVICGEFGRQINDNGGFGTDHGTGNDIIVIGEPVRGGIYGDKFPEAELDKFGEEGADIDGLTAIDHVFGRLCDWVSPNSASEVFPGIASAPREADLDLSQLLA